MATATEVTANEVEIKLNQRLKRSLEQDDRGEVFPIAELKKQFMEKLANGYYCK